MSFDTTRVDSLDSINNLPYEPSKQPTYQPNDRFGDPFSNRTSKSPLVLQDPASLKLDVEIDTGMNYTIYEKIGDINFRPTSQMSFQEFNNYHTSQLIRDYWKDKSLGLDGESAVSGRRLIPKLYISPIFDRIFGGDYVDIQPNGFVNLDFGGRWQRIQDPALPVRRQRNGSFNFDQQISMNVVGKVGEKLSVTANFDNNNTFDFQNDMKVEYTGFDEDIIKKIEIGNVSMPVSNSLMTGAQSLFGIKTQLQFGKLYVTGVASRQQGTMKSIRFNPCNPGESSSSNEANSFNANQGNSDFPILNAWDYAEYQHFFLGHFFRDNYEKWIARFPRKDNKGLSVDVGRVEVYQVNIRSNETQNLREVIAFTDLGEGSRINRPDIPEIGEGLAASGNLNPLDVPTQNDGNELFDYLINNPAMRDPTRAEEILRGLELEQGTDFLKVQARKMNIDEYTINPHTGFLSLKSPVNETEMIAVSYQYYYDNKQYKVGEVSQDYQGRRDDELIFLKLIKPNTPAPNHPTFDLMMKNVYRLGGANISEVQMQIEYQDFGSGLANLSIPEGKNTANQNLSQLLGLDRLNQNDDQLPDGIFDDNPATIYQGNLVFPILEPFGSNLEALFDDDESELVDKYVYDEIYNDTKQNAKLISEKDLYRLRVTNIVGDFSSSGSRGSTRGGGRVVAEKRLPAFNIPEESVVATMGSRTLINGIDYRIDFGSFVIINEQILNACQEITINFEETDLFNFQTKWLTGARAEYLFNDNFNVGATILRLNERPGGISRFTIGNEPISNTKYGFDVNFSSESRFLTKMVDFLPVISTKEASSINFSAEFAQLIPGTSNRVDGESTTYLEDFENAITPINLGSPLAWKLGATPTTDNNQFYDPSGLDANDSRPINDRRAKLAWYTVDNIFYTSERRSIKTR